MEATWVVYEDIICKPRRHEGDRLVSKKEWLEEVVLPFSHRVMIGRDLGGMFAQQGRTMARYNGLLAALSNEERIQVSPQPGEFVVRTPK